MGEENISPSLTSGKLTSITANVVCTDWVEKMGRDYEPGSNFNYTNSWGMHICSLYLVLNNQHMLLRYGLKCVCVPLLMSENKISKTVFWGTRADNFYSTKRNCSFVINIIIVGVIIIIIIVVVVVVVVVHVFFLPKEKWARPGNPSNCDALSEIWKLWLEKNF